MDSLYSGAAAVGQIRVFIGAIFATLVSLALIIYGIYLLYENWHLEEDNKAIVNSDSKCQLGKNNIQCTTNITYTVDGKAITKDFHGVNQYKKGDIVTVFYDSKDPNNSQIELPSRTFAGFIIGGGILLCVLSWGFYWLVQYFKPLAAAEGVFTAYQFLK